MEVGFATQGMASLDEEPWEDESPENSTMLLSRSFEQKNELAHLMPTFIRGETPDTIISDRVWYPDLCLYCSSCEEYVFVEDLPDHRLMHRYMAELDIEVTPEIPTANDLTSGRHMAVRRLKERGGSKVASLVHHINAAYDFLVKYFHTLPCHHYGPPYDRSEIDTEEVFSKGLRCSLASGLGVGAASFQNEKFREKMEDTMVYQDCFGQDPRKCYLGVFNGYNGNYASQLAADELHHSLLCEMLRFDPFTTCSCAYNMVEGHRIADLEIHRPRTQFSDRVGLHTTSSNIIEQIIHTCEERLDEMAASAADRQTPQSNQEEQGQAPTETTDIFELKMASAFTKSFYYTDWLLKRGQDQYSTVRWSGCGATCLLLRETEPPPGQTAKRFSASPTEIAKLYLANVGACHAVLVRNNRHYRLTQNHVPSRKRERKRVLEQGGTISCSKREPLVNGVLPFTRGLGSHGDPVLKRCVIATPYNSAVRIDDRCQAIILATPGFWHALSESEAMGLLVAELPCNRIEAPSRMSVDSLLGRRKQSAATRATTAATSRPTPFTDDSGLDGEFIQDVADDLSSGRMADVDTERLEDTPSVLVDELMTPDVGEASSIANTIARKLVQAAMLAGATENISVQVALFPAAFSSKWKLRINSRPSERQS